MTTTAAAVSESKNSCLATSAALTSESLNNCKSARDGSIASYNSCKTTTTAVALES